MEEESIYDCVTVGVKSQLDDGEREMMSVVWEEKDQQDVLEI